VYRGNIFDFTEEDFYYASLITPSHIEGAVVDKNTAVSNLENMAKKLCGVVTKKQVTKSASRKLKTFFVKTDNCSKDSLIYEYKTATDAGKVVSKFNKAIGDSLNEQDKAGGANSSPSDLTGGSKEARKQLSKVSKKVSKKDSPLLYCSNFKQEGKGEGGDEAGTKYDISYLIRPHDPAQPEFKEIKEPCKNSIWYKCRDSLENKILTKGRRNRDEEEELNERLEKWHDQTIKLTTFFTEKDNEENFTNLGEIASEILFTIANIDKLKEQGKEENPDEPLNRPCYTTSFYSHRAQWEERRDSLEKIFGLERTMELAGTMYLLNKKKPGDAAVAGPPDAAVAGPPDAAVAGHPDAAVAGPPGAAVAGHPDAAVAGHPDAAVAGPPGAAVAGQDVHDDQGHPLGEEKVNDGDGRLPPPPAAGQDVHDDVHSHHVAEGKGRDGDGLHAAAAAEVHDDIRVHAQNAPDRVDDVVPVHAIPVDQYGIEINSFTDYLGTKDNPSDLFLFLTLVKLYALLDTIELFAIFGQRYPEDTRGVFKMFGDNVSIWMKDRGKAIGRKMRTWNKSFKKFMSDVAKKKLGEAGKGMGGLASSGAKKFISGIGWGSSKIAEGVRTVGGHIFSALQNMQQGIQEGIQQGIQQGILPMSSIKTLTAETVCDEECQKSAEETQLMTQITKPIRDPSSGNIIGYSMDIAVNNGLTPRNMITALKKNIKFNDRDGGKERKEGEEDEPTISIDKLKKDVSGVIWKELLSQPVVDQKDIQHSMVQNDIINMHPTKEQESVMSMIINEEGKEGKQREEGDEKEIYIYDRSGQVMGVTEFSALLKAGTVHPMNISVVKRVVKGRSAGGGGRDPSSATCGITGSGAVRTISQCKEEHWVKRDCIWDNSKCVFNKLTDSKTSMVFTNKDQSDIYLVIVNKDKFDTKLEETAEKADATTTAATTSSGGGEVSYIMRGGKRTRRKKRHRKKRTPRTTRKR
jgi:hypothetical protein